MKGQQCVLEVPAFQRVRVIGDPILHQPGIPFPKDYTESEYSELIRQISIAKHILIKTGGGGIAANQCMEINQPYQFAIVGVFYESEEHVRGVQKRYPSVAFPQAMIMVNPVILESSKTTQSFYHGCLSVPCANRCEIKSPEQMKVEYLELTDSMKSVTALLNGKAAVALWHEINHILDGKTYIDTALAQLSEEQLNQFQTLVSAEINIRQTHQVIPDVTAPPFYFSITIDGHNQSQLHENVLAEVLPKMTLTTLLGLDARCKFLRSPDSSSREKHLFLHLEDLEHRIKELEKQLIHLVPQEQKETVQKGPSFFL